MGGGGVSRNVSAGDPVLRWSGGHFLPLQTAPPGAGENLRRNLSGTLLHLGLAGYAAELGFDLPGFTIATDVHITTSARGVVAVPPMPFNSHLLTVMHPRGFGAIMILTLHSKSAVSAPAVPTNSCLYR